MNNNMTGPGSNWVEMEPIPEENDVAVNYDGNGQHPAVRRKLLCYTSEHVASTVSRLPAEIALGLPQIDEQIVDDPAMATTFITDSLPGGAAVSRGSSYVCRYETHEEPVENGEENALSPDGLQQKVTRVTKVTTTRSVRALPDNATLSFGPDGQPLMSIEDRPDLSASPVSECGIPLRADQPRHHHFGGADASSLLSSPPGPAPPLGAGASSFIGVDRPSAPTVLEMGPSEVTLLWLPPTAFHPTGYQLEMREVSELHWRPAHQHLLHHTQCTIVNLDEDGAYEFRVAAATANSNRLGPFSDPSQPVRLSSVPAIAAGTSTDALMDSAPGRPSVTAVGADRVALEWSPPPLTGQMSAPLAGYLVEYRVHGQTDWMVATDQPIPDTQHTVAGLRPNGEYEFRVWARTADGLSAPSRPSSPIRVRSAAPLRASDYPAAATASAAHHRSHHPHHHASFPPQPHVADSDIDWVRLEWADGLPDGAIGYLVELREVGEPEWQLATPQPLDSTSVVLEGLREGSNYEFRLLAADPSAHPLGAPGEPSAMVLLRPQVHSQGLLRNQVPSQCPPPEYLDTSRLPDRLTLCWTPAASTLPVLGYDVEFRDFEQDGVWYRVNDAPLPHCKMTVGDLIPGHEYQFRVVARNAAGLSTPSAPSEPLSIPVDDELLTTAAAAPVGGGAETPAATTATPNQAAGLAKWVEAERWGAIRLLADEMRRESPPLDDRDDSPPPMGAYGTENGGRNHGLAWRDPNLREVLAYLRSNDRALQRNATGYLQHLTYNDNNIKAETRELGGIGLLINLLKSDDVEVTRNACACIKNLVFGRENDAIKEDVVETGGVRVLGALLRTTASSKVQEEALAALWNLSSWDGAKLAVLDSAADAAAGLLAVPPSVAASASLHSFYQSTLFKNATGVLRNVSGAGPPARAKLRSAPGLVDRLVDNVRAALQHEQTDTRSVENSMCILRNLTYRIQEVEETKEGNAVLEKEKKRSKWTSPKQPRRGKKKTGTDQDDRGRDQDDQHEEGVALLWASSTMGLYVRLLQETANVETLEATAGAIQNVAACNWAPSVRARALLRLHRALPVLVELIRVHDQSLVAAVASALRNLALDARNLELIGKYALRDLLAKLPPVPANSPPGTMGPNSAASPQPTTNGTLQRGGSLSSAEEETMVAVLSILFQVVSSSASATRDLHEQKGTLRLRALARSYPANSQLVCKYASQVLYMMWQHKELHDGFRRANLRDADFFAGPASARPQQTHTLGRAVHSQGRERLGPATDPHQRQYDSLPRPVAMQGGGEPLYAAVQKQQPRRSPDRDSWV